MKSDLEIARAATLRPIDEVAAEVGLAPDELIHYGPHMAKVPLEIAEACSVTTIVTRSFTWLAFKSRPRSANCELGVQSDPTVGF